MSDGSDSSQEKTEEPSARKLEKAREDGQIPRSKDLTTTAILLAGTGGLYFFGPMMSGSLMSIARNNLSLSRAEVFDTQAMIANLVSSFYEGLTSLIPLMLFLLAASILGPIALGGWLFSTKAMAPKMNRMDPFAGLKRMFSVKSLVELVKSLLKVALILGTAMLVLKAWQQEMLNLSLIDFRLGIAESLKISAYASIAMASITVLVALVDVPFQLFEHNKKLKMSHQELKDEHKDSEGKPEVKGRIRQLQREISERRMMSQVPEADVVITNPTHFSVALKYDPMNMATPILLAKGGDHMAFKIREIAKEYRIDIVESPMLARAIYFTTEPDEEVPAGLYTAVAQVLAYVFGLRSFRTGHGDRPEYPRNVKVPKDLRFD